jgi:hypothetical protein
MVQFGTSSKGENSLVDHDLANAYQYAAQGEACYAAVCVSAARDNAAKAGMALTEEQEAEIAAIIKLANTEGFIVNLANAYKYAAKGEACYAAASVSAARENAAKAGMVLTEEKEAEIAAIIRLANTQGFRVNLANAYQYAAKGEACYAAVSVLAARENARNAGIVLSTRQRETIRAIIAQYGPIQLPRLPERGRTSLPILVEICMMNAEKFEDVLFNSKIQGDLAKVHRLVKEVCKELARSGDLQRKAEYAQVLKTFSEDIAQTDRGYSGKIKTLAKGL